MYKILFAEVVKKQQKALPQKDLAVMKDLILALTENPRPPRCKKLAGGNAEYRIRYRDYRILYSVDDKTQQVIVYGILHRREAYR